VSLLERIFETKRTEVALAKRQTPLGLLREMAANADQPRGFRRALADSHQRPALIAEVKKASPSKGVIRCDFDAAVISQRYEAAGATALSVLTDAPYFQGSPANLTAARRTTNLPCLRKDFIEDPYQVYEARAWGADAVLLIVASLEEALLRDLQDLIRGLGMDALVEVHDEKEAERALAAGADLIGVNNRSLADFSTDLANGERILPLLSGAVGVAESAIETHDDVERMLRAGARAVLIGTTFCASPDIEGAVRGVMGW
jgi:indole-3-glycerol phosphate synthase